MADNPWRTQGDYQTEQRESRERHAMFQEQHAMLVESNLQLARAHKLNIVLVLATLIAAAANLWSAYSVAKAPVQYPPQESATQLSQPPAAIPGGKLDNPT